MSSTITNCSLEGPLEINTVLSLSLHMELHCLPTNEGTSQQTYSCFANTDVRNSQTCYYAAINTSIVLKSGGTL